MLQAHTEVPKKVCASDSATAPEWDTEEGIAARFAVSVHFIRKLRYSGKLRAATINGRLVRVKIEDARRLFEANATGGDGKGRAVGRCGVWAAKRAPRPTAKEKPEATE